MTRGLPGDDSDEQARWIEATVVKTGDPSGLYLPNGNPASGPKYDYKLAWMERLYHRAKALMEDETPALMAGDYNIILPKMPHVRTQDQTRFSPESRRHFQDLKPWLYRSISARGAAVAITVLGLSSRCMESQRRIRIDHFLLTPSCADMMVDCQIDKDVRVGKPSDHVPCVDRIRQLNRFGYVVIIDPIKLAYQ